MTPVTPLLIGDRGHNTAGWPYVHWITVLYHPLYRNYDHKDAPLMTPRESYVRAKIDHYCERIEECCLAARYPAARRLLDVVYALDPADLGYLELRNRVDEQFSALLRHPVAGVSGHVTAAISSAADGGRAAGGNGNGKSGIAGSSHGNGNGNVQGTSEGIRQDNGNRNGHGDNGRDSQGNGKGDLQSRAEGEKPGNGNGNGHGGNGGNGYGSSNGHVAHLTHPERLAVVVDQDERLLAHLALELPRHGYRLAGAASFEEATEILSLVSPDIVVSEVNFDAGSRGFDLFLWLRTHNVLSQTPFIFQATRIDSDVLLAGKRFGVDDFLLKPVDGAILAASATHAIHQRRPLPVSA